MNAGIIATRYSTALLELTSENGSGERVFSQVKVILDALGDVPGFSKAVSDPVVSDVSVKVSLAEAALAPSEVEPDLHRFLELLAANGRIADLRLILQTFVSVYCKSKGICRGRLVVPEESMLTESFKKKLSDLVAEENGARLDLEVEVDPSLIGGFVLELDDRLLDASVSRQLDIIRRQYAERNRRLV